MPDEHGVCRCGGAGWDGCSPSRPTPPPLDSQLLARLRSVTQDLQPDIFHRAAQRAISSRSKLSLASSPASSLSAPELARQLPAKRRPVDFASPDRQRIEEGR
jgi:uncharacterized protein YciW